MGMPVVERLVNLTVALLETRRPLTFEELRQRTGYYPQADASSARRMFERDKETLRSLGCPRGDAPGVRDGGSRLPHRPS
jgi:proteasome accessory factor B